MELNLAAQSPGFGLVVPHAGYDPSSQQPDRQSHCRLREVLELHPDDMWAKQQIDSLSKNK
jgi:hypothetical protein